MEKQRIMNRDKAMNNLPPVSPGELLKAEFLKPMGISPFSLAQKAGVPAQLVQSIVAGRNSITDDVDSKLCGFFGLSKGYWLRAQAAYTREIAG